MRGIHLLSSLSLLLALPAFASDGVLEISQTCAVETGCFTGDTAGFPVTINDTGSYRLTSNLTVPDANTGAIRVLDNNVSIDLNDFAITGPVTCSVPPAPCTPASGTGTGVEVNFLAISGTRVYNGSITGMGASGVLLGNDSRVRDLRVRWNRLDGINVQNGSSVTGVSVDANGNNGIEAGLASVIVGNSVTANGGYGIAAAKSSVVEGNASFLNGLGGIAAGVGCTIQNNAVRENLADGINALGGSTIRNNSSNSNSGDGIQLDLSGLVVGNTTNSNGDWGLNLGPNVGYEQSSLSSNVDGAITGGVALNTNNLCDGVLCP